MLIYTFEDTKTGKTFDDMMSIDKEDFLNKNSYQTVCNSNPNIVSGIVGMGQMKNDGGWKDNMSRIAEAQFDFITCTKIW